MKNVWQALGLSCDGCDPGVLAPTIGRQHTFVKKLDGNKNQTNINCDISDMWKQMIRMLFAAEVVQWKYHNCPGWEWLKKMVSGGKREPFIWERLSIQPCC